MTATTSIYSAYTVGDLPSGAMRRLFVSIPVLAVALTACASAGGAGTTVASSASTTIASQGTETPTTETATTQAEATGTTSGRPVAPDFTLELGDGGSYTLSEGTKPVYLVFWAEW